MKLVTAHSTFNAAEAQIIRSRLEAAGFQVFVANENAPITLGGFSKSTLIRVEVPENELAEVKAFLAAPAE